jgi:hypothetical protein
MATTTTVETENTGTVTRAGQSPPTAGLFANTFPAGLICGVCCDTALLDLCRLLAPLNFWNDCSLDSLRPGVDVTVPVAVSGSTTLIGTSGAPITNFEAGDATLRAITVPVAHISQPFHITDTQCQQGFRLQQLASINVAQLAKAIWDRVLPIIKNNASPLIGYPVANTVVKAIASFGPADAGTAYGLLACSPKHLILDPAAMAKLMFQAGGCCFPFGGTGAGAFGFASITEQNYWTGADANTYGFAYCPQAIVMVSGTPVNCGCENMIEQRTIRLPGIGLTVQFNLWCSTASRTYWGSYDVMFGAALGVACAGVTIKIA